ncbi:TPA: fimbrial-like protein [Citrobacter werkmanii]
MGFHCARWCYGIFTVLISQLVIINMAYSEQQNISVNVTANLIENSCKFSFSDSGVIDLGKQSISSIEDTDSFTNYIGHGQSFTINVSNCPSLDNDEISKLIFNFSPQSGSFPVESSQVFANEVSATDGGATGVGLVIFAEPQDQNVLDKSGQSNVAFDVTTGDYLNSYNFSARLQKINTITEGDFTTHVTVEVTYE